MDVIEYFEYALFMLVVLLCGASSNPQLNIIFKMLCHFNIH